MSDNLAEQETTAPLETEKESNVLTKIIDTKAEHIASLKQRFPQESLQPKISDRSLFDALKAPNAQYIFECKKASPSKGLIRPVFDVEAIASVYCRYAAAISVLTDEQFFQGDFNYIAKVRAKVSQPILCKDFFVDPYQVELAAHHGADAILLMLSVLDDEQYQRLAQYARQYNLDYLTEVSNQQELQRAIDLNAPIIGINNRNLRDLTTDLATTEALAPQIPSDRVVVSESGIYHHSQTQRLNPLVDGYLVGSSIMAQPDIDLACRQLVYGPNKVCGLTRYQDIELVAKAGASFGGMIFYPPSPRAINLEDANVLVSQMQRNQIALNLVGVFVNQPIEMLIEHAKQLQLFALQLHGNESTQYINELKQQLQQQSLHCEVWKAVAIDSQSAHEVELADGADKYLYDSKHAGQFGGTGETFDWGRKIDNKSQALLAGGLSADNIACAKQQGFAGLDINSGVESSPGIKDVTKVNAVFTQLRTN
ncbi:bifunctional indole-3-glycerol-phosphate synthase TrpC/phosphoribosylanthranilate isomerase TrpF [Shewanella intestini]|uniref:Multifunctional fusion protein n=1 Tax=Shewanella intestini TaxID=2017544 RepID=A0ABS5HYX7_9GAMM|nr:MULTISPECIES: bifunctional indole-3-glycerol-phosphate synthase TrpC/phosphoribosylanthranilate isomerase TrpF [Shewanella]MBR9726931.1 bifunctional indole-3-glycerol-phosphate synthase TrpC/phosphoribosylanthranilate isomerase TrpF [Shewanella intestini]MRG34503.1 bifunctional indole-3-glycerol-phosphate synthase TrpC/phosphoribosylanthranilate isomerase TrpF [Shewanella sp. XMDDZSB0408]